MVGRGGVLRDSAAESLGSAEFPGDTYPERHRCGNYHAPEIVALVMLKHSGWEVSVETTDMGSNKLPAFHFEVGCCLVRSIPNFSSRFSRHDWHIIGRLEDGTRFLLHYSGVGVTQWQCDVRLGEPLRKKILGRFREEVRRAQTPTPHIARHDLRQMDERDLQAGSSEAERIVRAFVDGQWRSAREKNRASNRGPTAIAARPAGDSLVTKSIRFDFISSYRGCWDYLVHGDGEPYRISERRRADSDERSIFNGSEAEWQRQVVAAVGLLYRADGRPISQGVVHAFNAWRAAEDAKDVAEILSKPERYGIHSREDPRLAPPIAARGAQYEFGKGWILNVGRPTSSDRDDVVTESPQDEADASPR